MTSRPPPVLDYRSAAPARPSFFAITVGILRRPSLAFRSELDLSYACRFARIHTLIASLMLGIGAHLYIAYLARLNLFGDSTGHWADGWFWIPLTFVCYVSFAAACQIALRVVHQRTAVLLNCAHLLLPATAIVSTVLIYYRLNWSFTIRAYERPYLILLILELVMGAAYVVLTFTIGSRGYQSSIAA